MKKNRSLVASFLIVLMLNTLSWSVGSAALADWVASEQAVATDAPCNGVIDSAADDHESQGGDNRCNDGCHASTHLQGIVFSAPSYYPTRDSYAVLGPLTSSEDNSQDGLFRPPRLPVLA